MMRILFILIRMIFWAPYCIVKFAQNAKNENMTWQERYDFLRKACIKSVKRGNITIETSGLENIPKEDGFIFFPNHQGMFDVLAFIQSCPRAFGFVFKKEISNIILLKQIIATTGSLAIDRKDLRQSMTVINDMTEAVKKGRNFLIFPEGTREREGNKLLEFKGGSFKSAQRAQCPIVPCALIDSYKPFDENSIKPVTVKLMYLKPMYYDEYKDMKTQEIAQEVKKRIEEAIASATS